MSPATTVLMSTVLSGCAFLTPSPEMPPFEGTSSLDQALQQRAYRAAFAFAQFDGCSDIDRVVTATVSPPMFQPMSLVLTERWVLHGCDETYPFLVNTSGDARGRTVVDVQSES